MPHKKTKGEGSHILLLSASGEFFLSANSLLPLERKVAALLSYLALQGRTPRSRLAGMLWPDSSETVARGNLRQRLHRLKQSLALEIVVGTDFLELGPMVQKDVALSFEQWQIPASELMRLPAELLAGHDFDDCPDLAEWVAAAREKLKLARRDAILLELEHCQVEENYSNAIAWSARLIELDPISEETYRRLMRLQYLQGDRAGALMTYQRCVWVLEKELGLAPMPETTELAQLVERGKDMGKKQSTRSEIPLTVLRPPVLAGREKEWNAIEAAWQQDLNIHVVGEAGVGKTRLMLDFINSKGSYAFIEGKPGENDLPFAAVARMCRQLLLGVSAESLPIWVRQEISRLVPSLSEVAPVALASEDQKLRFFEALAELILHNSSQHPEQKPVAVLADNVQFMDAASLEASQYLFSRLAENNIRSLMAYRSGELLPGIEWSIGQEVLQTKACVVEVRPLDQSGIAELMSCLQMPAQNMFSSKTIASPEFSQTLLRRTGGNPLFILETLKNLYETGQMDDGVLEKLPLPQKLIGLISKRLEALPIANLRLTRVAAVLGTNFDETNAAKMLDTTPNEIRNQIEKLQIAQIFLNNHFAHDLLFETALATIPVPVRRQLHARAYSVLRDTSAPEVSLAEHALQAKEFQFAVQHFAAAITDAMQVYASRDAIRCYQKMCEIINQENTQPQTVKNLQNTKAHFHAAMLAAEASSVLGEFEMVKIFCQDAVMQAEQMQQPELTCHALNRLGFSAAQIGNDLDFALSALQRSWQVAQHVRGRALAETEQVLALLYTFPLPGLKFHARLQQARKHGETAMRLAKKLKWKICEADSHNVLAYVECYLGEWGKAELHAKQGQKLYASLNRRVGETDCMVLQARILHAQGKLLAAVELAKFAAQNSTGFSEQNTSAHFCWACALYLQGEALAALEVLEMGRALSMKTRPQYQVSLMVLSAALFLASNQIALAEQELLKASKLAENHESLRAYPESWLCVLAAQRGQWQRAHTHAKNAQHWREPQRLPYLPGAAVYECLAFYKQHDSQELTARLEVLELQANKSAFYEMVFLKTKAVLSWHMADTKAAVAGFKKVNVLAKTLGFKSEVQLASLCLATIDAKETKLSDAGLMSEFQALRP